MKNIFRILLCLLVCSCSAPTTEEKRMQEAEDLMKTQPDSSLTLLSSIDRRNLTSKQQAEFALLYSQALDKNYIDTDNDSLIAVAMDYFIDHGDDKHKAKTYYYYAVIQENGGKMHEAIASLFKAEECVDNTDEEHMKFLIYMHIAFLYKEQGCADDCLHYIDKALQAAEKSQEARYIANALYFKGSMLCLSQPEKALPILTEAYHHYLPIDKNKAVEVQNTIVHLNLSQTSNTDTLLYYKNLFAAHYADSKTEMPPVSRAFWGYICHKLHQNDSARYHWSRYLEKEPKINSNNIGILEYLAGLEEESGNLEQALFYYKKYAHARDSIAKEQHRNLYTNMGGKTTIDLLRNENIMLSKIKQYQLLAVAYALVTLCGVAFYLFLWFKMILRRRNAKIVEMEDFIEQMKNHYDQLSKEYETFQASITQLHQQHNDMVLLLESRIQRFKELLELSHKYEKNPQMFYCKFKDDISVGTANKSEMMNTIISLANLMHDGFLNKLKSKYPALSDHELVYIALLCFGFSQESIRLLYNHTNNSSVYTMRSKIRTKLNMDGTSTNLDKFLIQLRGQL